MMMMTMITRIKRYLKFKQGYQNEWCIPVLDHVPFRSYFLHMPDRMGVQHCGWDGSHSGVTFDPYWIYQLEDNGEGFTGLYHTHPPHLGEAIPSQTDIDTMNAWVTCLGRGLQCWIDNGWDIACWYFDHYGYFRIRHVELLEDPLKYDWIRIKR